MPMSNSFSQKILNLEIKKILKLIILFDIITFSLIFSGLNDFSIQIIRTIVAFAFITFIPGLLLLRILKIQSLSFLEFILYDIGLSLTFIMLWGCLLCFIIPQSYYPLSIENLSVSLNLAIFLFCSIDYIKNKNRYPQENLSWDFDLNINWILLISIIPLLGIFAAVVSTKYHINSFQYLLCIIITLFVIIIVWNYCNVKTSLFALSIFCIGLSLLLSASLLSDYLRGSDIHIEYHFISLTKINLYWNFSIFDNINSLLSVTVLPVIYSNFLNIDIFVVLKAIYPFFFAFVPLCLYCVYKTQIDDVYAFLATIFFISIPIYYLELTSMARVEIAELFFALLILVMIDKKISKFQKGVLLCCFTFSLIVSHYGTMFIYIFLLSISFLLLKIIQKIFDVQFKNFSFLNVQYILLSFIMMISWYMYAGLSSPMVTITNITEEASKYLGLGFFTQTATDPMILQALGQQGPTSFVYLLMRIFYYLSFFFIFLGVVTTIRKIGIKDNNCKVDKEFLII